MRIDGRILATGLAALLPIALTAGAVARAADVAFDPTVLVSYYNDGNVDVVSAGGTAQSDDAGVIALDLPVTVRNPGSVVRFNYTPSAQMYREATERNNVAHRLRTSYDRDLTPRDSIAFALSANRSEYQRVEPDEPDRPITYLPRTRTTTIDFGVDGDDAVGRRSGLRWGLSASAFRNDGGEGLAYNDSETYAATFGWDYAATESTRAGFGYRVMMTDFQVGDSTVSHTAGYVGTTTTRQQVNLNYIVGVIATDSGNGYATDLGISFGADWAPRPDHTLSAGAKQDISQGVGVGGSTLDRGVYLGWRWAHPRGLGATVTTGYWDREGLQEQNRTRSLYASTTLSWAFSDYIRAGVFYTYRDQNDESAGGEPGQFDTAYNSAGIALTWKILGARGR